MRKKRNIRTALPRRSRTGQRPNHIMNRKDANKSFQSYKTNDRVLDPVTQKFVSNEDLLAEFICKIALIPNSNQDLSVSVKDTTGLDTTVGDQILNVSKGDQAKTNVSYHTNEVPDTSTDWIDNSLIKPSGNIHQKAIIRKDSEDSFLKMLNPKSNLPYKVINLKFNIFRSLYQTTVRS